MKDHEIAALVNDLTAIGREFGQAQQLRERIRQCVVAALAQPVAAEATHDKRCPTSYSTTNRCNCGA